MDDNAIKYFVEAALLGAGRPLSVDQLQKLFDGRSTPEKSQIRQAISSLLDDYAERGITITEVASGFRMQIEGDMVDRLQKLWEERPPRYSRALFETLALIAYRQPMTRGEIEEIRGVAVSTNIIRTLLEREWVRVVGHRDVPGRPSMFGTTRQFLDYFGLKKLDELPPLADLSDWESLRVQLNLPVEEEESEEIFLAGDPRELPVLYLEDEDESASTEPETDVPTSSLEEALPEEFDEPPASVDDVEPIKAVAWPDPAGKSAATRRNDRNSDKTTDDEAVEENGLPNLLRSVDAKQTGS